MSWDGKIFVCKCLVQCDLLRVTVAFSCKGIWLQNLLIEGLWPNKANIWWIQEGALGMCAHFRSNYFSISWSFC